MRCGRLTRECGQNSRPRSLRACAIEIHFTVCRRFPPAGFENRGNTKAGKASREARFFSLGFRGNTKAGKASREARFFSVSDLEQTQVKSPRSGDFFCFLVSFKLSLVASPPRARGDGEMDFNCSCPKLTLSAKSDYSLSLHEHTGTQLF